MAETTESIKRLRTKAAVDNNDPSIEVGQIWVAKINDKIMRRIRILAPYPECGLMKPSDIDGRLWLYEELSGGTYRMLTGRLEVFPEFNLRYVFELESDAN